MNKVCKKHGELSVDQTYLLKRKRTALIRMCLICKKGYKNDWKEKNPEKLKLSQEKLRISRLEELKNGSLNFICKVHGKLPTNRIRVNARGTIICRDCANIIKEKSIKNDPDYKEKKRKWLYSDRERVVRYRKQDIPNRVKRNRKRYFKLKEDDPVKFRNMQLEKMKSMKKKVEELDKGYIEHLIRSKSFGSKKNRQYEYYNSGIIPDDLIELKRLEIKLKREIRKNRRIENGN